MYSIEEIAAIIHAPGILHSPASTVQYLLTDSRRIVFPEASLFFALQSSTGNGEFFINELYRHGVKNFVVRTNFNTTPFPDANFILVEDTLHALQLLASHQRAKFSYPVIGITGSNGKTVVKEWLYQLLSAQYNIVRSPRSYNSQIGVPLSVWQMSNENTLAIFEAGISKKDEMEKLEKIIQPTLGILTNIGEAHSENFSNDIEKAKEKIKLFNNAAVLFCNADDAVIQQAIPLHHAYTIFSWGKNENATVKIITIQKMQWQTHVQITYNHASFVFTIPFTDEASIQNAVICFCVLLYLNISHAEIAQKFLQLQPVNMRLQLVQAINNCSVINDSYSFDLTSFSIALDFLLQQLQYIQKTVILSDIPFVNNESAYTQIANMLYEKKIQRVITIGTQWINYHALLNTKIAITQQYKTTEQFLQQFASNQFRDEVILLKGARIFGFEKIAALLQSKSHQTVMEINLTAIAFNLKKFQQLLKPGVKLMAMVKAFGYGSGSASVANVLQFHKVDYLAVAYPDEGIELRKAGISLPIMVMNIDEESFETIIEHNLEPELFSFHILKSFVSFLEKNAMQQYPVHIKLDTGMHRLGFEEKDIDKLASFIKHNSRIYIKSVFSHLAAAEDAGEDAFTKLQAEKFLQCCHTIQAVLNYSFLKHIANSAAAARNSHWQFDMVRIGIGLYGVDNADKHLNLLPVATLKTTVAQLRSVLAGDTVGYNRRGKVNRNSTIATIRIGYADGFSRALGNGIGKVFVNGMLAPVIGSVCMDMTMIDVTDVPSIKEGDEVEIFGANIPVAMVAKAAGTIPYEILSIINQRVKRIYVEE